MESRFKLQNEMIEGSGNGLKGLTPQCLNCIWLNPETLNTCIAFPNGIPIEIRTNEVDHRLPYPNDRSIRYIPLRAEIDHPMEQETKKGGNT